MRRSKKGPLKDKIVTDNDLFRPHRNMDRSLCKHGSLEGRVRCQLDARTVVFVRPVKAEPEVDQQKLTEANNRNVERVKNNYQKIMHRVGPKNTFHKGGKGGLKYIPPDLTPPEALDNA